MPNHFHLMVSVNYTELINESDTMTSSYHITNSKRTLNNSVAIMLRSYTRAVNKETGLSGSLFRAHTKAECLNCPRGVTPSFITKNGITEIKTGNTEKEYPQICFHYIHQNPVKAGLVVKATDWEFSSARDYAGLRDGKLINKKLAEELGLI
jgi:putative transposase